MEQEAADELQGVEAKDLLLAIIRVVSVAEGNAIVLEVQDSGVGDRDAMGVGTEVCEHALGSREGRLGVDDPVEVSKLVSERGDRGVLAELAMLEGLPEVLDELGPEHLGQGTHGEEEALVARRDEALPI